MNGKDGVEEMRQTDTMRFRNQPKQVPIAVKAPRAAVLHNFEARLVMAIEQFIGNAARWRLVGQFQRLGAKPEYLGLRRWAGGLRAGSCFSSVHAPFHWESLA